jgi:homoserine dehydrogenase
VHPNNIVFTGIQNIQLSDAVVAKEKHYGIKLVAQAQKQSNGKVAAFVLPQFVSQDDHLAFVKNEYNGVVIESGFADKQFFYGKGAGSFPTASAVLSDISALSYGYRYEYKKLRYHTPSELTNDFYIKVYTSFNALKNIPKEEFEWIEEFHNGQDRSYLIGVIHFDKLVKDDWWKQEGISLIALPDSIIENLDVRNLKKRSLELAGIV